MGILFYLLIQVRSPRDVHEQDRCVLPGNVHEQGALSPPCSGAGPPEELPDTPPCEQCPRAALRPQGLLGFRQSRGMDSILLHGPRLVKEGKANRLTAGTLSPLCWVLLTRVWWPAAWSYSHADGHQKLVLGPRRSLWRFKSCVKLGHSSTHQKCPFQDQR